MTDIDSRTEQLQADIISLEKSKSEVTELKKNIYCKTIRSKFYEKNKFRVLTVKRENIVKLFFALLDFRGELQVERSNHGVASEGDGTVEE